ncbi:ERF superfamily protein [Ureibacillus xyleni]|uniref:ERF superfamily protein n=1 Tax=Ureibacillus xyleni TaxID=614648 RepID=A0A285TMP6_9BACL|nr:ERF family protein [Ureibacillus xyleni]SOC22041.1 ERF superfamily protein [Ureibacillus xyleni]
MTTNQSLPTTTAPTTLLRKLVEVRKAVPYLKKSSTGHQYNFVGSSNVLAAVRDKLDETGLVLFPKVMSREVTQTVTENKDKYGNLKKTVTYFTELFLEFTWFDSETGESYVVPFYAQGIDTSNEKGVGKALTYAEKYFLLKSFNIPTDQDDPDTFQQKAGQLSISYIAENQVSELEALLNQLANVCQTDFSAVFERFALEFNVKALDKVTTEHFGMAKRAIKDWLKKATASQQPQPKQASNQQQNVQPVQVASQVIQQPQYEQVKEAYKVLSTTSRLAADNSSYMEMQVQNTVGQTLTVLARGESYKKACDLVIGSNYNLAIIEENNMFFLA